MDLKRVTVLLQLAASAALFLSVLSPAGAVLVNGDFSDPTDLAGWTATGDVIDEPTGDFAQLATDGSFQRTLEQSFTLPSAASILAFDFAFSTDATDVAVGIFPASFAVSLISAGGDFLDILVVDLFGAIADPSDGIEWFTGALAIDVSLDSAVTIPGFMAFAGGTSYFGRVSLLLPAAVLGQGATLYFDLFDADDGAATIAALDNVSLRPAAAVPAPTTLGLLLIGLAAAAATPRRRS